MPRSQSGTTSTGMLRLLSLSKCKCKCKCNTSASRRGMITSAAALSVSSEKAIPISSDLLYRSHYLNCLPQSSTSITGSTTSTGGNATGPEVGGPGYRIHLMEITSTTKPLPSSSNRLALPLPACLLLHGSIENGSIFYSKNGKGLGPFLARAGFKVYVPDLRGHGQSTPAIAKEGALADYGQTHTITETIPLLSQAVKQLAPDCSGKQAWLSHSWGGVMMASALVRFPEELLSRVVCQVHFGAKRQITANRSWEYFKAISFGWQRFCPLAVLAYGYLPSKRLKIGSDDETGTFLRDTNVWLQQGTPWRGVDDGFDYALARADLLAQGSYKLPPAWHIAAANDPVLGNPTDVHLWAAESGASTADSKDEVTVLSVANGNQEDYNHNTMLTSKQCEIDHFPHVVEWISRQSQVS